MPSYRFAAKAGALRAFMIAIPAIDILGGQCARLRRGDYNSACFFGDDPRRMAQHFLAAGAKRLHLVDLDAAKDGHSDNTSIIADMLRDIADAGAQSQVGGGLRRITDIQRVVDAGASFAIIGTAAIRSEAFRNEAIATFPQKIILGLDARDGRVAVAGWREESPQSVDDLLTATAAVPPAAMVFTDIGRDGMLGGANVQETARIAERAPCPVIASGGIRNAADVRMLAAAHDNISGAIIGRAVYEDFSILSDLLSC